MFKINLLVVLMTIVSNITIAQTQSKKIPTQEEYKLYHSLGVSSASDDGKWISYLKKYKSVPATLFVANVSTKRTFSIVDIGTLGLSFGEFGNGFFAYVLKNSSVGILNLSSGKTSLLNGCSKYYIAFNKTNIVGVRGKGKFKSILIADGRGVILDSITNVTEETLSPSGNSLVFAQKSDIGFVLKNYELSNRKTQILYESKEEMQNIVFGEADKYVGFFSGVATEPNTVHLIDRSSGSHNYHTISEKDSLKIYLNKSLKISRDGKKVFFDTYAVSNIKKTDEDVEIWHSSDRIIYPVRKEQDSYKKYFFSVWYPQNKMFRRLGLAGEKAELSGKENYVIFYEKGNDGLDGKRYHVNNIYIEPLEKGNRSLVIKDITMEVRRVSLSPVDDKMVYYYKNQWWCYDMKSDKHISLTKAINGQWDDRTEMRTQTDVYDGALWTADGQSLLLQDKNDLWLVSSDGLSAKRITNGKEQDIEFRVDWYGLLKNKIKHPYLSLQYPTIPLNHPVSLTASASNGEKGYFILNNNKLPQKLFYGNFAASQLYQAKQGRYFATVQSFDMPPAVRWADGAEQPIETAVTSNPQHSNYSWGKSELITYRAPDGRFFRSALLYPAGYDPAKKYPMVVKIYQNLSSNLHEYVLPSLLDDVGFNHVNYTLDGYFVLMPDIGYTFGKTGISASESVEAVVNKVKEMGIIDSSRIGLIGHSFGGYEVNFIMTRSSTFATAVSGAGISDMTGWYFSTAQGNGYKGTEAWRFESQQWRMGKSFYERKESYYENSPIFHAEKISTPMLIWSGKDDTTVPASQSLALYHAMRRLNKPAVFLQYKGENHTFLKSENQRDLSEKIKHWFDHYLKDKKPAEWMSPNTN